MRNLIFIALLYLILSVLVISCTGTDPEPACVEVTVLEQDCDSNWFILQVDGMQGKGILPGGCYGGQLIATDNLPQEFRTPGLRLSLSFQEKSSYTRQCMANAVTYPSVKVKRVCATLTEG